MLLRGESSPHKRRRRQLDFDLEKSPRQKRPGQHLGAMAFPSMDSLEADDLKSETEKRTSLDSVQSLDVETRRDLLAGRPEGNWFGRNSELRIGTSTSRRVDRFCWWRSSEFAWWSWRWPHGGRQLSVFKPLDLHGRYPQQGRRWGSPWSGTRRYAWRTQDTRFIQVRVAGVATLRPV
jgi:hypothetical protein